MSRNFKATVSKPTPEIILSTAKYIEFIENNSDMSWNEICDFIYKKGYLTHEEDTQDYIDIGTEPKQDRIDDHGYDYEWEFAQAHPWCKDIAVRFVFDD
jgi:hypothetical protein